MRLLFLTLLLASTAVAEPGAILVDGRVLNKAVLVSGTRDTITFSHAGQVVPIPTTSVVSITLEELLVVPTPRPYNLYLRNGDRLAGMVRGHKDTVFVDGKGVEALRIPLAEVKAVRFGRLLGALQAKYDEVFAKELKRGRDVVIIQRETKPYPQPARVLGISSNTLRVLVGDKERELELHKVFGFIHATDPPDALAGGLRARLHLKDGGRITLPMDRIDKTTIGAGEGSVSRSLVWRIEFLGGHIAHLSDFDPIEIKETALFGKAPRWRRDAMVHGGPLRIDGHTYARGIGVQAYSRLEFVLGGRWSSFFVRCGIDDVAGAEGEATFRILLDGKIVKEIRRRRGEETAVVTLPVKGADRLVLEVDPGDSYISDFCDWADARVFNAPVQDQPRKGE